MSKIKPSGHLNIQTSESKEKKNKQLFYTKGDNTLQLREDQGPVLSSRPKEEKGTTEDSTMLKHEYGLETRQQNYITIASPINFLADNYAVTVTENMLALKEKKYNMVFMNR